jgi:hypothetical protein
MRYRDLLASPIRALWRPGWEAEAFEKRRILWRYQSGMFQIKGLARAKMRSVVLKCKRVTSPWSWSSAMVVVRSRGFVSSYLVAKEDSIRSPSKFCD